jgi:hypothetical protein
MKCDSSEGEAGHDISYLFSGILTLPASFRLTFHVAQIGAVREPPLRKDPSRAHEYLALASLLLRLL